MPVSGSRPVSRRTFRVAAVSTLCAAALVLPLAAQAAPAQAVATLPASDAYRATADIGFHDWTRDGSEREIRNDLAGELGAMVEFVQETTVTATGNAAANRPMLVSGRDALLMVTPTADVSALTVTVRANGDTLGTLALEAPKALPESDQSYGSRGSVTYSLRAWSAELPAEWVVPGMTLTVTNGTGTSGEVAEVEMSAPKEIVINNIELGMLTNAPESASHAFLNEPLKSATDYFQTIPVAKLTMAQYEQVELDKVIVSNGDIYTVDSPDPSVGTVYAGTMRADVAKAQFSTGVNLATFGITSSPMNQKQPGSTNQRVIHHAAGLYVNEGRVEHGLSGGNGMATLYSSTGNELSHELGHSYGLGHFPGVDATKTGDDMVRDASHNMDSGWGYIPYRGLMRSNLSTAPYQETVTVNGDPFGESLIGLYNFNADTMSSGWDASPASDYTLLTGYSLKIAQNYLQDLVADTAYPSGYRDWDEKKGWVDAAELDSEFDLIRPTEVGVPVFTLLGGYNPANTDQTLVYDAFRSNYGVTFDLPQANTTSDSAERACWVEVEFDAAQTQHIALDASDGMKQLNVNIAESERPTGAQVSCREHGTTTKLGNRITFATDLEPLPAASVVGDDAGYEQLRTQELAELDPKLAALADKSTPILDVADLIVLEGWADDLSGLGDAARKVAERIFQMQSDADDVDAYLAEHASKGVTAVDVPELREFLKDRGYVDSEGEILPSGTPVAVDNGACLYVEGTTLRVDSNTDCSGSHEDTWFVDVAGRIHSAANPDLCITYFNPFGLDACSTTEVNQRWLFNDDTTVVRAANIKSAMDYNRTTKFVTAYGVSGTGNQRWVGFETNTNPLLPYLSSRALAALVGNAPAAVDPPQEEIGETPGDAGGNTGDNDDTVGDEDGTVTDGEDSVEGDNGADMPEVTEPEDGAANTDTDSSQGTANSTADANADSTETGDSTGIETTPETANTTSNDTSSNNTSSSDSNSSQGSESSVAGQGAEPSEASPQSDGLAQTGAAALWSVGAVAIALLIAGSILVLMRRARIA